MNIVFEGMAGPPNQPSKTSGQDEAPGAHVDIRTQTRQCEELSAQRGPDTTWHTDGDKMCDR